MDMYFTSEEELAARIIGRHVLTELKRDEVLREILASAQSEASLTLEEIRKVMDNDDLDDPACFQRIEEIIRVLDNGGIPTLRHDW